MPLVTITHSPNVPSDRLVEWGRDLTVIIAEELHFAGNINAHLKPEQVTVKFLAYGPNDINTIPLEVRIEAQYFPERAANKSMRLERIKRRACTSKSFPQLSEDTCKGFLWLVLVEGAYEKF